MWLILAALVELSRHAGACAEIIAGAGVQPAALPPAWYPRMLVVGGRTIACADLTGGERLVAVVPGTDLPVDEMETARKKLDPTKPARGLVTLRAFGRRIDPGDWELVSTSTDEDVLARAGVTAHVRRADGACPDDARCIARPAGGMMAIQTDPPADVDALVALLDDSRPLPAGPLVRERDPILVEAGPELAFVPGTDGGAGVLSLLSLRVVGNSGPGFALEANATVASAGGGVVTLAGAGTRFYLAHDDVAPYLHVGGEVLVTPNAPLFLVGLVGLGGEAAIGHLVADGRVDLELLSGAVFLDASLAAGVRF